MSFDLVVLSGTRHLDADEARDAYERISAGAEWSTVLDEDARIGRFVAALSARSPVALTMRVDAPDAVIEFCESTALELGLNVFDPQDGTLYSPGREPRHATARPQKTLICERCGRPIEPGTPYAESPRLLHMACLLAQFP